MVYIADRALKHCTLYMHADVLTRVHFVLLLEIVLYVRFVYILRANISITMCFVMCPSLIVH